ncbi:MAG: hypothetical protein JRJ44_05450 [Deltaproteobacteria bacterium]|nr:hypothetical protein [Deltaproteobacteria bacterium]
MRKDIENFYNDLNKLLKKEYPSLSVEFEKRIRTRSPKKIFIWLDNELKNKLFSLELNELLTDFFFSIH